MNFRTKKKLVEWNFSALTDIVFLLLIFFLLTSSFVMQSGIKVNLPVAEQTGVEDRKITVTIDKNRDIFIDRKKVTVQTFPAQLRSILESAEDSVVVFRADESIDLGFFVQVMDMSKSAGAKALAIATRPRE